MPWLTTDWILGQFSPQNAAAKRRYAGFIQRGLGEGDRIEFHSGGEDDTRVLSEDRFTTKVLKRALKREQPLSIQKIVQSVCRQYEIEEPELSNRSRPRNLAEARGLIAWLMVQNESGTLTELAKKFNRDLSSLSLAVSKIDKKRKENKDFAAKIVKLNNSITQA